jgi:LuxR family transcriptional regulator, maltose regulon positive regulatory protein
VSGLVAVDAQDTPTVSAVPAAVRPNRQVADYLRAEVLSPLRDEEITFLTRTATLERMCASLCDAVLERTGSAEMLDSLGRSNGFVVPLDDCGEWYRYHHLFRAVLMRELEHREPDAIPIFNRRAAEWYGDHGGPENAIEYAFAGGDLDHAARLVRACQVDVYQSGRLGTLRGWVERLDRAGLLEKHPAIAIWGAWAQGRSGHPAEAERWADMARRACGNGQLVDRSATIELCEATLRACMCRQGEEQMRADAQRALELAPAWSYWRSTASRLLGIALVLDGDTDRADEVFADTVELAREMGMNDDSSICLAERSLLAMARRDVRSAERFAREARRVVHDAGLDEYVTSAITYAAMGKVALHRHDVARAQDEFARADRLRPLLTWFMPHLAVQVRLELVRDRLAHADPVGARVLLREIDQLLRRVPALGVLSEQAGQLRGQVEAMRTLSGDAALLTAAERRVMSLLSTHLSIGEIAERQFVSRATVKTQAISIYRKLNVTCRSDAVERAAEIGLVDAAVVPPPRDFDPSG